MADPNTRQGKRTPVTLKIKFKSETLEQFIERYAVDVSQGGIFIRTKEPLAVGTQMRFEFQLRDASPLIGGEGTVVWTRENDPSRPAIAPGMGVRFDRLADGSQSVLERILAEKAKQAPQRPAAETTKPPLFTDTPTRVAPAPIAEQLLGAPGNRRDYNDSHTPLPKPMPFHSDADEFPEEAFEEATKVRALDELIAQTAEGGQAASNGVDELAARRSGPLRQDSTLADPPAPQSPHLADVPATLDPSSTSPGFASGRASGLAVDRDSAPGLPSPPDVAAKQPRLLDTSPSPRTERPTADPMVGLAKTKLGMEPVPAVPRMQAPSAQPPIRDGLDRARPSGVVPPGAVPHEATTPMKMPVKQGRSVAPLIILLLMLVAAGGAGVWFFVLREKAEDDTKTAGNDPPKTGSDTVKPPSNGSDTVKIPNNGNATNQGSDDVPKPGSNTPPTAALVATDLATNAPRATIEVLGTDQKGAAPLSANLEKDKAYKVRVVAPGYVAQDVEVKGGQAKLVIKLEPKPRIIMVTSEPKGALILLERAAIGHSTPFDVKLSNAQALKRTVRIGLIKGGYRPIDRQVPIEAFEEEDTRMVAKLDLKMEVQQVVIRQPPPPGGGSGSGSGSDSGTGSGSSEPGGGSAPPPPPDGSGSGSAPPPPPEPEPEFIKP